ncbi:MAG: MaoC family dehydratase N-terminal domain-containing protein [Bacillaceae bacterium]|nr:MaoC family dehydratase N-terminal domain-containing protein [Bacillaceae bacterium]
MFGDFVGKRSDRVKNIVERGAVKKFAEAIGDPHPIFVDEVYAAKTRFKRNLAPPTFPRVFDYGRIEGFPFPVDGLIHGEQSFYYERPLYVGEQLYCYAEVDDYYEKTGKSGTLGFLVLKNYGEDLAGEKIFNATMVIIITEAVRKELAVK